MSKIPSESYLSLYDEADAQGPDSPRDPAADISPLYHALERIEVRYSQGTLIAKGGMKEVLRVYDERTERFVALARPKDGTPRERYDAFLREAHITARLEHPNIIKLFDMGIDDQQRPFFTMEFKQGDSLRKILTDLKTGRDAPEFGYQKRLSVFLRICEAIGYAHSRHVLHLDLKPENIQVGTFGEVQVCDWGMGEIERGESEQHFSEALLDPDLYGDQLDQSVKGTPGYMAPEQLDPKVRKSAQTDIFALGCLLYELTQLRSPDSRHKAPPESPAIAAIVSKACAEDPFDRYPSVDALHKDVRRHLLGFSAGVERAGFRREIRLFYRRNRIPCLISLFFTLLVVGTVIWFTQKLRGSYNQTAEALVRTEKALMAADQARNHAEEALARYELEHEYAAALFESRDQSAIDKTLFLIDFLMMKESIHLPVIENSLMEIDKLLASNPPATDRLWTLKAHVLFTIQRFEEAEKFYAIREGDQGSLRALIPEFAPLVGKDSLLPVEDFNRLLVRLTSSNRSRYPLMEKMIIYDSIKRNSPADTARIIHAMLQLSNRKWKNQIFDYNPTNGSLRLSGTGLWSLYRSGARRQERDIPVRSLLRLLNLRSLDIRGSNIADLWHLEGVNLHSLDIRRTPVTDLEPLAGMVSLRELIIAPGQFTKEQLAVLRGLVVVRELPLKGR